MKQCEAHLEKINFERVNGPILVGFSGGLDSTVLLHVLMTGDHHSQQRVRAIHVHHGLHASADTWAQHCQEFCNSHGVELVIAHVNVKRDSGQGLEAAAREARYASFAQHLQQGEVLSLAHHQDDQAETVLLRLLRASGSQGLAAMQAQRRFSQSMLWRPLLKTPRTALFEYATLHRLSWIEDASNTDQNFDRNFLRHRILPSIIERWPHAVSALARSAELLAEDTQLLRQETQKRLASIQGFHSSTLPTNALLSEEKPWRSRILKLWLEELGLPPLPGHALDTIERNVLEARPDSEPKYQWAGAILRRWREYLYANWNQPKLPTDWHCQWNTQQTLNLPTGDRLHWTRHNTSTITVAPTATNEIPLKFMVQTRHGGERILLPGRKHSHALKHVFQDRGIPPWERERMPLIFSEDGQLLAAGDQIISARLQQLSQQQSMQLFWEIRNSPANNQCL